MNAFAFAGPAFCFSMLISSIFAQASVESVHWGTPVGNIQVGWQAAKTMFNLGHPITLAVYMRRMPPDGPAIEITSMTLLRGKYEIEVFRDGNRTPVSLTKAGKELEEPWEHFTEVRGVALDQSSIVVDQINLNDLWEIAEPGHYTVSIAHRPSKSSTIAKAPEFHFLILARH